MKNVHKIGKELFITNDEEIKEGDWMYYKHFGEDVVTNYNTWGGQNTNVNEHKDYYKKIILTTDPQLITDGVQAIDDEFLEWFVKNPSCEEVEVGYDKDVFPYGVETAKGYGWYKIIIPKEEPNFSTSLEKTITTINLANSMFGSKEEPKQETLEEVAEEFYSEQSKAYEDEIEPMFDTSRYLVSGFIEGAKWQAKQDKNKYSEEDLLDLIQFLALNETFDYDSISRDTAKLFLNQFKKK